MTTLLPQGVSLAQQTQLQRDLNSRLEYQSVQLQQQKALIERLIGEKVKYEASNDVVIGDDKGITAETYPEEWWVGFGDGGCVLVVVDGCWWWIGVGGGGGVLVVDWCWWWRRGVGGGTRSFGEKNDNK